MKEPLIAGADIEGQRVYACLDDMRDIPLDFPTRIRRVTILDTGRRMVVETIDGTISSFTAARLAQQTTLTA
jgi:hypothetical protein